MDSSHLKAVCGKLWEGKALWALVGIPIIAYSRTASSDANATLWAAGICQIIGLMPPAYAACVTIKELRGESILKRWCRYFTELYHLIFGARSPDSVAVGLATGQGKLEGYPAELAITGGTNVEERLDRLEKFQLAALSRFKHIEHSIEALGRDVRHLVDREARTRSEEITGLRKLVERFLVGGIDWTFVSLSYFTAGAVLASFS